MSHRVRKDLRPAFRPGPPISLSRRRLLRSGAVAVGGALAWSAMSPGGELHAEVAIAQSEPLILWSDHPEWSDGMNALVQAFTDETGISVTFDLRPRNDYLAQLETAKRTGDEADVLGLLAGTMLQRYADEQRIVDVTGLIRVEELIAPAVAQITYADRIWGSPLGSFTIAWFFQRAKFAQHGLEAPRSWDELVSVCQALQDAGETPIMMPAADAVAPYYFLMLAVSSNVGQAGMAPSYRGLPSTTPAQLAEAARLLVRLKPYFNADFASTDYESGQSRFANGDAALTIAGSWTYSGPNAILIGDQLGVFGFPSSVGGPPATVTGLELIYAVNAASGREEASTFVAWLASTTAQHIVSDRMALPVHRDVLPEADATAREIVSVRQAGVDLPVWDAFSEADRSFEVASKAMSDLLFEALSPDDFAAMLLQEGLAR